MSYTFPGITRYIDDAAESHGLTDLDQVHRAKSGWHLKTIVDALSQLPGMVERAEAGHIDPKAPADVVARIKSTRDALAVQLQGLDDAIADVLDGVGLASEPAKKTKKPRRPKASSEPADAENLDGSADDSASGDDE